MSRKKHRKKFRQFIVAGLAEIRGLHLPGHALENLDLRAAQLAQVRGGRALGHPWVNALGPNWLKRMLADTRAPKPRNLPLWF